MKRDMELIRQITLALENGPVGSIDGIEPSVFGYHAKLMMEAGLAEGAQNAPSRHGIPATGMLWCLTWAGHDFADAIRSDTVWNAVKERLLKPAASWTFGILLECLGSEIRRHIPGLS